MVSILICSKYNIQFSKCVESIVASATLHDYEIIIKVDSIEEECHRKSILEKLDVKYKIIQNDVSGYENLHVMANQMAEIAKGDLLWTMADDCYVIGDWHGAFLAVQKLNPDNIFVINTHVSENWAVCPVVSRGWYDALGYISLCPTNDAFLRWTGVISKRYLSVPPKFSSLKIIHEQGADSGVPKRIRKPSRVRARRASKSAGRIIQNAVWEFYEK